MSDFDIIVIGAGPAGCYAALTAARNGCKVAIFEEHLAVGRPRHDPGWLMECDFSASLMGVLGRVVPWTRAEEYRVCRAESGDVSERSAVAGFLVRRDIFDREVAAAAVQAGARLFLKTRVTGLVRSSGRVQGVETNSESMPGAAGQVIICAEGIRSATSGFAVEEGLCERTEARPGISYLVANAEVTQGVIEHFVSSDPVLNYRVFWAQGDGVCYFILPVGLTLDALASRQDNVVSRKIRRACALEISGFGRSTTGKYGEHFKRIVKDNVMFVGDASGGSGNIHGMIQGQLAGRVAAAAVREKDTSEERLREYQDKVFRTLGKAPFCWYSAREDFGSFDNWFRAFRDVTRGMEAGEIAR